MTSRDLDIVMAVCSQLIQEQRVPVAEHGVAVATTWSPRDDVVNQKFASTVEVAAGKTAAIIGDDGDVGLAKPRVHMATSAWGLSYAPRGGERVVMVPTEEHAIGLIIHGDDDAAQINPGETILRHYNGETALNNQGNPGPGTVNTSLYFANDAISTNDNLGQVTALLGGFASFLTTHGYGFTINDANGNILVSANTVQIAGSGTATGDAVVRQSDLVTLLANIQAQLGIWAAANLQGGHTAAGPTTLTSIVPTASAKTYTA